MTTGFIKLFRQMTDWEWYTNVNVFKLFMHCLVKANFQDKEWRGIIIKKGSFVTSYENLSRETGLTMRQIRTSLDKLKTTGELTHQTTSRYSIITINNWDKWQADDKQCVSQTTVTKESKEDKKEIEEKEKIIEEKEKIKEEKEKFNEFYELYPKKEDEYKTFTLYLTLINEKIVTQDELINGVKRYKEYTKGSEPRFIKSPFNWLNDMSWQNPYKRAETERENETQYGYNAFI